MSDERCPTCDRPLKTHDGPSGPPRKRFTVSIPPGEEGVLEDLLVQFVERFKPLWEMDDPMPGVGDRHWKYVALHYGLYCLVTADGDTAQRLMPAEIGT
jgi:hypothetical protein